MTALVIDDRRATDVKPEYKLELHENSFALYDPNGYILLHFDVATERMDITEREGRIAYTAASHEGFSVHSFIKTT